MSVSSRVLRPAGLLAAAAVAVSTLPAAALASRTPADLAASRTRALSLLRHPDLKPSHQIVTVTSRTWTSQRAVVRRYAGTDGQWRQVGQPVRAWIGGRGFVPAHRRHQNSGQTPAGVFSLPQAFGARPEPEVDVPYLRFTKRSYWPYDPRDPNTYNVLQPRRAADAKWRADGQWSERLADYGRQYRYAVVVGYNLPTTTVFDARRREWRAERPARTSGGGGIFLHVDRGRPTAGCVALAGPQMRRLLLWLDADSHPRIVMGPRDFVRSRWQPSSGQ